MSVVIKYTDIAPGAKQAFVPSVTDKLDFVDLAQLQQDELVFDNFGTVGELNQTLLNKSQKILPDDVTGIPLGLWSNSMSDETGRLQRRLY